MAGRVRVGFIGVGGHGMQHVNACAKMADEVGIVAFCDPKEGVAQSRADEFGGKAFLSADEMYDAVKIDAVIITVPPYAHGCEFGAVDHGIAFMVEKPVDLDLDRAQRIAKAAAEKGVLGVAAYMNRYRRGVNEAKSVFTDDPPVLAMGGWIGGSPGLPKDGPGHWWIHKDQSGGQMVEQATHTVDLARFFCGEPIEVAAFAATGFNTPHPEYTIEDAVLIAAKFDSGALVTLYSSCASNAAGGVDLNVFAKHTCARFSGWNHDVAILRPGKEPIEIAGEGDIFAIEDRAFIEAVKTGDPSGIMSTYADGAETLRLTAAGDRAIATGQVQKLC